jgi:DNA-binding transcriptional ArsR family regulator
MPFPKRALLARALAVGALAAATAATGRRDLLVDEIAEVLDAVAAADDAIEPTELQGATELSETKLASALARLEEAGAVHVLRRARSRRPRRTLRPPCEAPPRRPKSGACSTARAWT